jgi:hypothetical protein
MEKENLRRCQDSQQVKIVVLEPRACKNCWLIAARAPRISSLARSQRRIGAAGTRFGLFCYPLIHVIRPILTLEGERSHRLDNRKRFNSAV